jgi:cyclohexanecarboxylate-CoA ligase
MVDGRTLWELIDNRADATPDAVAAIDEHDRTMTFAEYRVEVERTAAGLHRNGIGPGSVVTWQLPTWLESMVLVGALGRLGAVQNPVLPIYRERELGFVVRQARSDLLVVPSTFGGFDFESMARQIAASVEGCTVLVADKALPQGDPATLPPPPDPAADEVRWYFYTSGTTSDPKGAQHTDRTVMAASKAMNERLELRAEDRSAMVFPFTHIGGINWLMSCLITGCRLIFIEAFVPDRIVEVLRRNDVTIAGAGTVFHQTYLAAQRAAGPEPIFPSVRVFPGGGAPKPPQLHHDVKAELGGAGIVTGYGLTEAPILVMASVHDTDEQLAHTEGFATPGVQLRVVTVEGKEGGIDEEGEIRAKGPQVMKGYLDSSLDADAFDDAGWFRTGDLGRIDSDGMVTITGRLKDIIIRKGENISAKEIEDLLFAHPDVADVAVVGLPDERSGERACAVVVPAEGAQPTLESLNAHLLDQGLMKQKLPEQLELVDVLPRNPTGKVLKFELRDRFG